MYIMKNQNAFDNDKELHFLCSIVKKYIQNGEFSECKNIICQAMAKYPHAPEPHNLFGIVLEEQNDHDGAMKHFRAACDLDPTYLPAKHNLDCFGTFFSEFICAYDESDCERDEGACSCNEYAVKYDNEGIGRIVRRDEQ